MKRSHFKSHPALVGHKAATVLHQGTAGGGRVVNSTPSLRIKCGLVSPMQLEQLEARRAQVLNQKAFCIQCCWRRFKQKKLAKERWSATVIQAGSLIRSLLNII